MRENQKTQDSTCDLPHCLPKVEYDPMVDTHIMA